MRCDGCRWVEKAKCAHEKFVARKRKPFIIWDQSDGRDRPPWCPLKLCQGCDIELDAGDTLIGWCSTCGTWIDEGPPTVIDVVHTCAICLVPMKHIDPPKDCLVCKRTPMPSHIHITCDGPHKSTTICVLSQGIADA